MASCTVKVKSLPMFVVARYDCGIAKIFLFEHISFSSIFMNNPVRVLFKQYII
jgi:hypothetical protein